MLILLAQDQLLILFLVYSSLHLVYAFVLQVLWTRYLRSWRRICINRQHFAAKMRQQVDLSSLLPGLKVGCGSKRMGPQRASKGTCEGSLEAGLMEMKVNQLA
jgi:hypothetical protein